MNISSILQLLKDTPSTNEKLVILKKNESNETLKKVLKYGVDHMMPFHIVKVPKTRSRLAFPLNEIDSWKEFFAVADECSERKITGNAAIDRVSTVFSAVSEENEFWMRNILKKHLAIGVSSKTLKKAFPELIQIFELALANKFHQSRLPASSDVILEPKLDGIRCFSIVRGNDVKMFARSGKLITNFEDTLAPELLKLGDGCYDGELMGEDFISLMRQAYRKENVDASETYLALFDYLPLEEWDNRESEMTCKARYDELLRRIFKNGADTSLLTPVNRKTTKPDYEEIKDFHDVCVTNGFEGAMIKDPNAPYKFGRGWEVMKFKAFHDADVSVTGWEEGIGKHRGKLGAIKVDYNGVTVKVGSGFSDELREQIWAHRDDYIGRIVEVRYQEVTEDGSLRFPTFVCFRNDR